MSEVKRKKHRVREIEKDPRHHLAGAFVSPDVQTPIHTPKSRRASQVDFLKYFHRELPPPQGFFRDIINLRWMRVPSTSFKMLLVPLVLWANWEYFTPGPFNPFACFMFLSHPIPGGNNTYQKGYLDLLFLAYYIVFFSFVRQIITVQLFQRIAKWWGIRSSGKTERYGEQGYAMIYFGISGLWGIKVMSGLPTWWYRSEAFWIDYPHWRMPADLKRYYLMQFSYWLQQLLVMVLGMEKPRSDFLELVIHHFITLWLISWSYMMNLTYIGNGVFISMDIPDSVFALSKLLNYMDIAAKIPCFGIFVVLWSYFRHYLNILMIKSAWTEMRLIPEWAQQWKPSEGAWLVWWMQYQVINPLVLLQLLNLFWYFLIWRILLRSIFSSTKLDDDRSDHEDDATEKPHND